MTFAPPASRFQFCPSCGARLSAPAAAGLLTCGSCGFHYYFNPACATAALFIRPDGMALFIRRKLEPQRGKLALPGGFLNEGETAEEGVRREFVEEVGIDPGTVTFLCSHPNEYPWRGIRYPVLDLFFTATASGSEEAQALDGVDSVHWLDPLTVDLDEIAFPSMRHALEVYRRHRGAAIPSPAPA